MLSKKPVYNSSASQGMTSFNTPKPIKDHKWEADAQPMVSIACLTYNHEKYIRDTLEGFLIQKTTFPVEILIHDDASTDKTADIIRDYESRYPNLFKVIYQTENQYSKGNKPARINRGRAKGKYVALCEGDDYWTDTLKLQKQVDFLEENENYSMVCSNFSIVDENKKLVDLWAWKGDKTNPIISQEVILERYTPQLLTVLMRKKHLDKIESVYSAYKFPNGDVALFSAITKFGPCHYMNEITGCYRMNPNGIWSEKSIDEKLSMRFTTLRNLSLFHAGSKIANKSIYERMVKTCRVLFFISIKKAALTDSIKYSYYYLIYKIKSSL